MALAGAKKILAVENGDMFMSSLKVHISRELVIGRSGVHLFELKEVTRVPLILVSGGYDIRNWKKLHRTRSKCCH